METENFKLKVDKIAKLLDMQVVFKGDMSWSKYAHLTKNEQKIKISTNDSRERGKLRISAEFPCSNKGERCYYGSDISINVADTKTPELIKRDIEKRLLPLYLPVLEKTIENINKRNIFNNKQKDNLQKMADYFQTEVDCNSNVYIYDKTKGRSLRLENYDSDTVKFVLNVTPETAIKVFELLKSEK